MKKLFTILSAVILLCGFTSSDAPKIPAIAIKKTDGTVINTNTFSNNGKPMIISFWATWCKPCKMELDAIALKYVDLQKETGVKLIAVCIDDARSSSRALTELKTKGWLYECYLDEKMEFMKAMNAPNVPFTALVDGKGEIVWTHNEYKAGDEDTLINNVRKLAKGELLSH